MNKINKRRFISSAFYISSALFLFCGIGASFQIAHHFFNYPVIHASAQLRTVNVPKGTPYALFVTDINSHNNIQHISSNFSGTVDETQNMGNQTYEHIITPHEQNIWVNANDLNRKSVQKRITKNKKQIKKVRPKKIIKRKKPKRKIIRKKKNKVYIMPFTYTSQFWPSKVKGGCEVASLKMCLSVFHKATHTSLATMTHRIPVTKSPNNGYKGNPFKRGGAEIYPKGLVKVARRYHVRARNITHARTSTVINYIKHGNPIVFEGTNDMEYNKKSDHVLALLGYKKGYLYYADPWSSMRNHRKEGWVSDYKFNRIFHGKKQGARAIVILK